MGYKSIALVSLGITMGMAYTVACGGGPSSAGAASTAELEAQVASLELEMSRFQCFRDHMLDDYRWVLDDDGWDRRDGNDGYVLYWFTGPDSDAMYAYQDCW